FLLVEDLLAAALDFRVLEHVLQSFVAQQLNDAQPVRLVASIPSIRRHGDQDVALRAQDIFSRQFAGVDFVGFLEEIPRTVGIQECQSCHSVRLVGLGYFCVILVDDTSGAGRETKAALTGHDWPAELRRCVGDVMIEPKSAVGMKGQVGDDIATAYFHQSVLHKFGLDEKVRVDVLKSCNERAADEPVEISSSNQSHVRITSSTGINGRLKAVATPSWVIFPS